MFECKAIRLYIFVASLVDRVVAFLSVEECGRFSLMYADELV